MKERVSARADQKRRSATRDRDDEAVIADAIPAPAKLTRSGESAPAMTPAQRCTEPGKLTCSDVDDDRAMTPADGLAYSRWMLAQDRGWNAPPAGLLGRIDRRAAPGQAEIDDVGGLGEAFAFLRDTRGGRPLPNELRAQLERAVGVDLGGVRLHEDAAAHGAAAALGARAFTIGDDIYFARGAYDPSSDDGIELIAHECKHVAQARRGAPADRRRVSRPDDSHERDADEFARRFTARLRRQFSTSDPAELVEHVRQHGEQIGLPFRDELEQHFGQSFDFVKVYTGPAARLACDLMSAGAFAVRDIVALAEPSPRRDLLLHELTHIVQMGGRNAAAPEHLERGSVTIGVKDSAAEREASAAPGSPHEGADHNVIHRAGKSDSADSADNTKAIERVTAYAPATLTDFGEVGSDTRKDLIWAANIDGDYFPRYRLSQEKSFRATDYQNASPKKNKPGDLEEVFGNPQDRTNVGGKRLHKVAGGRWLFTGGKDAYVEKPLENLKLVPREKWKALSGAVDNAVGLAAIKAINGVKGVDDFRWGKHALGWTDAAITDSDTDAYLAPLIALVVSQDCFLNKDANWSFFYEEVVKANVFRRPYKPVVGQIFEKLVGKSLASDKQFPVKECQLVIEFTSGKRVRADGFIKPADLETGKKAILAECKAWTKGPGQGERKQMRLYRDIITNSKCYQCITDGVKELKFDHVAYYFADKAVSKKWKKALSEEFDNAQQYSMVPLPEGTTTTTVKYNPTFEIPVEEGKTQVSLKDPPIRHPGLTVKAIDIQLDDSSGVKSGHITAGLDVADGAIKNPIKTEPIAAGANGVGEVANKFDGLTSTLSKALGNNIKVEAGLVDEGVKATVTMISGAKAMGGFTLTGGSVSLTYGGSGDFAVSGSVGLERQVGNGKISGNLTLGYGAGGWAIHGDVTVSKGVVEGLEQFTGGFDYENGKLTLLCEVAQIKKTFSAITLTGTAMDISYDTTAESFSGTATLEADMGAFGTASGTATVKNNKLTKASISYDSPDLTYPAKSAKPTFTGTVGGTLTYDNGKFGGDIRGTANLNVPALQKVAGENGVGLKVDAHVTPEGGYGGTVGTTTPLKFGDHFQIPSVMCRLHDDGSMTGTFAIEVVKFKHLEHARIECAVDKDGFKVTKANIKVPFDGGKLWGSLAVDYVEGKGLVIAGEVNCKIKEGMVAKGTLKYSTETNVVDMKLSVDEITLLKFGPVEKNLFTFTKQIPLVSIYGLGIYLDLGIDLLFSYEFNLGLRPTISLEGMSMETFEYKKIAAEMELVGALIARLTAQPKVGLGIFALTPSLLRGGGGIKIPITGEAALKPKAKLAVAYSPDGGVTGEAKVGMALTFGIKGEVKPYAELAVLDGAWKPNWTGDALASFEIMPPKELFNFELDLAGDMKQKEPKIPDKPGAPTDGANRLPEEKPAPKEAGGGAADREATPPASGPSGDGGGLPDEPLKLSSLLSGLKGLPGYQTIEGILKKAGAAWEKIKGFFGRVVKAFKSWFDAVAGSMEEIIDGFAKEGLGYMPKLIKKLVGDSVWEMIEPIVTALGGVGEKLLEMFESSPPKNLNDFFPWALRTAASAWGLAFNSIPSLVTALSTMADKLGSATTRIVTKLVANGSIGVKRHSYYIWNPVGKNWNFFAATEYKIKLIGVDIYFRDTGMITDPRNVVGAALYDTFETMGVPPTGGYDDPQIGANSRDRWA